MGLDIFYLFCFLFGSQKAKRNCQVVVFPISGDNQATDGRFLEPGIPAAVTGELIWQARMMQASLAACWRNNFSC